MSLKIKAIQWLKALAESLKESAIKSTERELVVCSERTDIAEETALTRLEFADKLYQEMQERALAKYVKEQKLVELKRKEAKEKHEQLKAL